MEFYGFLSIVNLWEGHQNFLAFCSAKLNRKNIRGFILTVKNDFTVEMKKYDSLVKFLYLQLLFCQTFDSKVKFDLNNNDTLWVRRCKFQVCLKLRLFYVEN